MLTYRLHFYPHQYLSTTRVAGSPSRQDPLVAAFPPHTVCTAVLHCDLLHCHTQLLLYNIRFKSVLMALILFFTVVPLYIAYFTVLGWYGRTQYYQFRLFKTKITDFITFYSMVLDSMRNRFVQYQNRIYASFVYDFCMKSYGKFTS